MLEEYAYLLPVHKELMPLHQDSSDCRCLQCCVDRVAEPQPPRLDVARNQSTIHNALEAVYANREEELNTMDTLSAEPAVQVIEVALQDCVRRRKERQSLVALSTNQLPRQSVESKQPDCSREQFDRARKQLLQLQKESGTVTYTVKCVALTTSAGVAVVLASLAVPLKALLAGFIIDAGGVSLAVRCLQKLPNQQREALESAVARYLSKHPDIVTRAEAQAAGVSYADLSNYEQKNCS